MDREFDSSFFFFVYADGTVEITVVLGLWFWNLIGMSCLVLFTVIVGKMGAKRKSCKRTTLTDPPTLLFESHQGNPQLVL